MVAVFQGLSMELINQRKVCEKCPDVLITLALSFVIRFSEFSNGPKKQLRVQEVQCQNYPGGSGRIQVGKSSTLHKGLDL